ncbi:MAG: valine--tRNA ligase [Verrucomicrobiota bacterium]
MPLAAPPKERSSGERLLYKKGARGKYPRMSELSKAYAPVEVERKWYARWLEAGCFRGEESAEEEGFSIVIPPPNVTGILHMGHVLNNTIQDILARRARQEGKAVLWLPGTDHAGIATQTRVEKELRKTEKVTRRDLGREKFLERVWAWKEEYGGIIIQQLKRLGCSCDWERERFTMDEDYSRWVAKVFTDLFEQGLIYRGKRMVNWCPVSLTALSDEEVIMKPQRSQLYTMKYEVVGQPGRFLEIATTRPETLMGDVAVAVHPEDERYASLIGQKVRRPFPAAEIPVIGDEYVDQEFGTGALKITPAHDPADFDIGTRHDLEIIDVLHPDGKIHCPEVPELDGLDRFAARKKAAEMLEERDALLRVEEYDNNVGFSERADVPIEPRLSMQWFLRYPCVEESAEAVASGAIAFRPARWAKTFAHWMENIQDWCISRQLWWGHQIPVWYRADQAAALREAESLDLKDLEAGVIHVGIDPPENEGEWVRDEDVLDTWFSSWLWPFATMARVDQENETLKKFYPTSDLVTGPDILFFWVARMIMAGFRFRGEKPFANVFFTSLIRDQKGRKLSKSLGNSPDPLLLMEEYGSDGLRFGLMRIAPVGTDVRYDEKQIEEGRNFANKLWNACRYRQMQGDGLMADRLDAALCPIYGLDVLAKLDAMEQAVAAAYQEYRFNEIAAQLYEFFWSEFCDWYLESIKEDLRGAGEAARREQALAVIDTVLPRFLMQLHPFMPHVTEELWLLLGFGQEGEFLMRRCLPQKEKAAAALGERGAQARVAKIYGAVRQARHLKAEYHLASNREVRFVLKTEEDWIAGESAVLASLAQSQAVVVDPTYQAERGTPVAVTDLGELFLPLEGLVDLEAERERLSKELKKTEIEVKKCQGKLGNASFVDRAPAEVVEQERARLADWEDKRQRLQEQLASLG